MQSVVQKQPSPISSTNKVGEGQGPMVAPQQAVPQLTIERIIGMSQSGSSGSSHVIDGGVQSHSSLAVNPINGDLAYIAGAFIVIYGVKTSRQEQFLKNDKGRAWQCLAYCKNGSYLAAGDSSMKQPEIVVWHVSEMEKNGRAYTLKHRLSGHRFGIQSIQFSPSMDYLISLGDANDRGIFVWDYQEEVRVTSNRLGRPVNCFAFEVNQKYFVTAGCSHLKFWYFDDSGKVRKSQADGSKECILESFAADLTKVKQKIFVGVACKESLVYALAGDGHLYVFSEERKLSKWMNIKVTRAFGCTIDPTADALYCACADGIIRVFNPTNLSHITTLQKPPPLGQTNIETGVKKIKVANTQSSKFADVLAVIPDQARHRIISVYSDKMVFLWDVKDTNKIQVIRTFLSHNGPIHDIQKVDPKFSIGLSSTDEAKILQKEKGLTRFVTCASDRTIRFWHYIDNSSISPQNKQLVQKGLFRNAYCKDMSKIIFVQNIEDIQQHNFDVFKAKPIERNEEGNKIESLNDGDYDEIQMRKSQDVEQAIRCLRLSLDGKQVGCGDWHGNIRIHDLEDPNLEEIKCIEAHENEVLSIDFARYVNSDSQFEGSVLSKDSQNGEGNLLVSGSRDRLVQVYDSNSDYEPIQIIEEHQSTVTSVRFLEEQVQNKSKQCFQISLLSCGADKKIVKYTFMQGQKVNDLDPFKLKESEDCKNKIFSMDLAKASGKNGQSGSIVLTGHDRILNLRNMEQLGKIWEKRPDPNRKVVPDHLKVMLDPYGQVAVTSTTDKQIILFEAQSGRLLCKAQCGELTTGMCFSENGRHLITTSSLGVIYIWTLPQSVSNMLRSSQRPSVKSGISDLQLDQIDEEDMEDTVKNRQVLGAAAKKATQENVRLELDDVFKQIGKVADVVKQIENKTAPNSGPPDGQRSQSAASQESADSDHQPQALMDTLKEPNEIEAKADGDQSVPGINASHSQVSQANDQSRDQSVLTKLVFQQKSGEGSLPRWAQSEVGASGVSKQQSREATRAAAEDSMEHLFERNLSQIAGPGPAEEAKYAEGDANQSGRYKIDLLDGADDEDADGNLNGEEQMDEEEILVRATFKSNAYESVFGIEGTESQVSSRLRQSRTFLSMRSLAGVRASIAGKFFSKKDASDFDAREGIGEDDSEKKELRQTRSQISKGPFGDQRDPSSLNAIVDPASKTPKVPVSDKLKMDSAYASSQFNNATVKQGQVPLQMAENNDNIIESKPSVVSLNQQDAAIDLDDINLNVGLNEDTKSSQIAASGNDMLFKHLERADRTNDQDQQVKTDASVAVKSALNAPKAQPSPSATVALTAPPIASAAAGTMMEAQDDGKGDDIGLPDDQQKDEEGLFSVDDEGEDTMRKRPGKKKKKKKAGNGDGSASSALDNDGDLDIFQNRDTLEAPQSDATQQSVQIKPNQISLKPPVAASASQVAGQVNNLMSSQVISQSQASSAIFSERVGANRRPSHAAGKPPQSDSSLVFYDSQDSRKLESLQGTAGPVPSQATATSQQQINFQLHCEIQRINDSLRNIQGILGGSQQLLGQSMKTNSDGNYSALGSQALGSFGPNMSNGPLKNSSYVSNQNLQTLGSQQSDVPKVKIEQSVSNQLSQSIGLWNTMMYQMQTNTSLDVNNVQQQSLQYSQQIPPHALSPPNAPSIDQSSGGLPSAYFSATSKDPYMMATMKSQTSQGGLTQVSVKDDARDLLEKYSDILLETLQKKMYQQQSSGMRGGQFTSFGAQNNEQNNSQ